MGDLEKQEERVCVGVGVDGGDEDEKERLVMEGMAVLDFDMLCSTVAMQTHGKWTMLQDDDVGGDSGDFGGVFRLWEGEVLDCFDDRRIALESACCPCYRFGKNMRRAGFGYCFLQGTLYFILAVSALINFVAFVVTKKYCFLYLAVAFTISVGTYLGFFRTWIRKKFNIRVGDSSLDDCIYHMFCPCCSLCQESRTLEINNVQDGTWHGRGDTICIGSYADANKALFELHPPPIAVISPQIAAAP
ncbi:hypothetical protein HS088_TW21G01133 [Tripterygium wilfordii]|uniref:PLAC8 family protein n=1 Tax=Tripterygium wilfordii TaxID=458696 RepID=A0A7J7C5D6_TRIWF|nr:protein PLANT CADMIUM RESISTANCE 10 [Tripterygium wilfordii]KAF5728976.1 hypothetical protein HS088_TW21G01133 [Tripterygium wilfordii]